MRMLHPGVRVRRKVNQLLLEFFDQYQWDDFEEANRLLAEFYKIKIPTVKWYAKIDNGRTLGCTDADGTISLTHPEDWKRMKATANFSPTATNWIWTVYHEYYHHLHFFDEEAKADAFARKFTRGLR